ncbi:hypothetical protein JN535_01410 [Cellulosimicrobium cellulans]|uniref:hypothetical protein n=1 Tax=Cellulosimicrobium cellulans TaxID=1710 RepID=UPI0019634C17|nr:hypothetical protein [Cellulosimicrobium cellulans]MBN0038828.1 hypothetical protein [Cellulosimicrobium cellulans]
MNDDDLAAALRDRLRAAPLDPDLDPAKVLTRARRARTRRRVGMVSGSVVALVAVAALVVPAALGASGTDPSDRPDPVMPGGPSDPSSPGLSTSDPEPSTPARDTNGVRVCGNHVAQSSGNTVTQYEPDGTTYEVGGLEGWWNSIPADTDGSYLPVEEWPQQILDHPATATVETVSGTVLESFDRRTCRPVEDYVPPPAETLPADAIVVLDAQTGEVLAEQALNTPTTP